VIIGVTGDTHNNLKNIKKICSIFNQNGAELVLHTGDISLPKSLSAFKDLKCPLIAVLGNNDIEEEKGLKLAAKEFACEIFDEPHSIKLNNKNISLLHHPHLINPDMLIKIDFILHGHTHRYRLEENNNCIIFKPGECAGFMEGKNQVGLIDLEKLDAIVVNF